MASNVNPAVQKSAPSAERTQRISTKTRFGFSSLLGGAVALGAGAAAAHYGVAGGIPTVVQTVTDFIKPYVTNVQVVDGIRALNDRLLRGNIKVVALSAVAVVTGAAIGGTVGQLTAPQASLNDVKARLGIGGSDLNFSQIRRIADIAVEGGIFSESSTTVQIKEDAVRIRNLNNELTNTEYSLSSNAHNTSIARGTEDRFFDLEGGRLANLSVTTVEFLSSLKALKSAIFAEVKATDKYTFQKGNSSTSISRREYILAGIMSFAHDRGIAANYLTSAARERAELVKANPKLAEANFRKAIQNGVLAGILTPNADAKCYEGMVNSAAVASLASSAGKNPDAVVTAIYNAFKEAGLVEGNLRSRFVSDTRAKMSNPETEIIDPVTRQSGSATSLIEKIRDQKTNSASAELQHKSSLEDGLDAPSEETASQIKARLAAEAEAQATSDVNAYSDTLASLDPRQKELGELFEKLIKLLNEKSVPLNQIMEMGPRRLRGALTMRHRQGFDLFERYEANDAAIAQTREQIATLTDEIDLARSPRPENFKLSTKEQRKAAEALEKQVAAEDVRIEGLKAKAEKANAKIEQVEGTLEENENRASTFLFPATETLLDEPVLPKQPGFFATFFNNSKKAEEVVEAQAEEAVEAAEAAEEVVPVEIESGLEEPSVVNAAEEIAVPVEAAQVQEEGIPEPVIETNKPSWKFWA